MTRRERVPRISITPQDSGRVVLRLGIIAFVVYLLFQIDFLAIVASMLIASYWSSYFLARGALSGIRVTISTKQLRSRCGESIDARLRFQNKNRFLPVFFPTTSIREKSSRRIQAFQFHGVVFPGKEIELSIDPTLSRRGLRQLEAINPRSHFPFALHLAVSTERSTSPDIIVWPRPDSLDVDSLLNDPPRFLFETFGEHSFHSQTIEAARIREYQPGDPKQRINWKLSAKLDKLTIIEPRDERQQRYELHLETSNQVWPTAFIFERMLRLVTALVSELSRRKIIQGITIDSIHYPLTSNRELTRFYDALAIIQPTNSSLQEATPARRRHLWILPAPNSEIMLAQQSGPILEKEVLR